MKWPAVSLFGGIHINKWYYKSRNMLTDLLLSGSYPIGPVGIFHDLIQEEAHDIPLR